MKQILYAKRIPNFWKIQEDTNDVNKLGNMLRNPGKDFLSEMQHKDFLKTDKSGVTKVQYNKLLDENNLSSRYERIQNGEKIKFTYLKEPNSLHDNVIAYVNTLPKEFGLDKYIDYDLQFEKSYIDPIKTVLDVIGWKHEKTSSLEGFFG